LSPVTAFLRANVDTVRSTRSWNFPYTCLPIHRSRPNILRYNSEDAL